MRLAALSCSSRVKHIVSVGLVLEAQEGVVRECEKPERGHARTKRELRKATKPKIKNKNNRASYLQ